ncbi:DNA repair exonuclease SbcCD ATPase subunit [Kribbella orskensis]|uniref:DNA repair exonuclease SbcCD ATPase subunit n=1 Tax=Kribbella orskensis TaxID=2512216 RepID=A0ABY2B8C2_9ACTN|nr:MULTISPECIES: AAA family ATPase [Kribbella]TCN31082.1 DNA repair exonuclease SbcCD ATPase subunit [Kribbella sp. VKM Ac-2500]TCO11617.1 DNA repair exonuclease SbcCD ATPase subunit [Kribbella orskensis]
MRLHSLTLRNFRGVKDRTVDLPAIGTTVVVGDNEVGKSSLVEAFALVFDFPDDSKSTRIRDIQPVGQDVAPEVTVELTLGGRELAYTKRWLKNRSTELSIVDPDGRRQTWTGREAHNEAERLFAENVDPVLWQTLMVGQGQSLVLPTPADAEPLITAVTAESGTPVDGASMPLVTAVEHEYLRYWTRGGRPHGEYAKSAAVVATAELAAEQALKAMDEVVADIRRAERLALDLDDLSSRLGDHLKSVEDLRERKKATDEILLRRDSIRSRAETARARLENHTRTRLERERLLADVERFTKADAELAERRTDAETVARKAADTVHTAEAALAEVVELKDERRAQVQDAERLVSLLMDRAELDRLTGQQAELVDVRVRIAAAGTVLDGIKVDDATVAELEDARAKVVEARAALAAGVPEVLVRRAGAEAVELSGTGLDAGSGKKVPGSLAEDGEIELLVSGELVVGVPGQVEVKVRAGGEAATLRARVDEAVRREKDLLKKARVKDLPAARELLRKGDLASAELQEARRTERSLTAGGDPAERIALLAARLGIVEGEEPAEERESKQPAVEAVPGQMSLFEQFEPDENAFDFEDFEVPAPMDVAELAVAQRRLEDARSELAEVERLLADAEFAAAQARKAADEDRSEAQQARARAELAGERLTAAVEALEAARAVLADEDVDSAEVEATAEVESVLDELTAVQEQVDAAGADEVAGELADALAVATRLQGERDVLRDSLRTTEGRLEQSGRDGLATRRDSAELDLAAIRAEHESLKRRADAARRVYETLGRHRAEAQTKYSEPLQNRIEALGRSVYGPSFRVWLDDDLAVAERELDGARLRVEALSTGAQEQLAIITRLAISHLVSTGDSSVPVIFDDALGWSDKGRLRDMGALLGRAGDHGQVIILTCMPERYEHVPRATFIKLEA